MIDLNNLYFVSKNDSDFVSAYIISNCFKEEFNEKNNLWWYHSNLIFDYKKVQRIRDTLISQNCLEIKLTILKVPKFFTEIPQNIIDFSKSQIIKTND